MLYLIVILALARAVKRLCSSRKIESRQIGIETFEAKNTQVSPNEPPKHKSAFISVKQCLKCSTNVEKSLQIKTFLCKTNPILWLFRPKTKMQSQNEPNSNPNEPNLKPIIGFRLA